MQAITLRRPVNWFSAAAMLLISACFQIPAQGRVWTDAAGKTSEAEYISSTSDSVMVRQANGQAVRLKLSDLSPADREFVAKQQAAEKEAQMIDAVIAGDIIWRLPAWNSLSWNNTHPAEIWLWDDKTKAPTEKVASVKVNYTREQKNRNEFNGKFKTDAPVHLAKTARLVVKAKFGATVNGTEKNLEETSVPMSLPALKNGTIDLPAVRLSITR